MNWRYGLTRDENGYSIREIYTDEETGEIMWSYNPQAPYGETARELMEDLERMLKDAGLYRTIDVRELTDKSE